MTNVTNMFKNAMGTKVEVSYNDTTGQYEIWNTEYNDTLSVYDDGSEDVLQKVSDAIEELSMLGEEVNK